MHAKRSDGQEAGGEFLKYKTLMSLRARAERGAKQSPLNQPELVERLCLYIGRLLRADALATTYYLFSLDAVQLRQEPRIIGFWFILPS